MTGGGSFEEFYTGSVGRLLGHLFLVTGDLHEAEEVVQEAFARASVRWSWLRHYNAPEGWVRRVAMNLAADRARKLRRQAKAILRMGPPAEATEGRLPAGAGRSGGVPSAVLGAGKRQPVMASGTVKWFDPNRGYGFIRPDQGEDVFVHISAVQSSRLQSLQDGQAVEFDIQPGRKGPQATSLRPPQAPASG